MAYRPELSSMDKDTILFLRKNRIGLAFHWDFYARNKSIISKIFLNDVPILTLYKCDTTPGLASWVDFTKAVAAGQYDNVKSTYHFDDQTKTATIIRDYAQNCCDAAFSKGNYLASAINGLIIPQVEYIDAEGYRYSIGHNDGTESYVLHERLNAGGNSNKAITVAQGSIVNKTLGFENRHLMEDLKLTFNGSTPENTIVTLNSQLVPVVQDNVDQSVGWIRQGLKMTSYMNNDFTKNADYSVKTPVEIVNEEVRSETEFTPEDKLYNLEPRSNLRYFYNNVKSHVFCVNPTTGELKRIKNINSNNWDILELPKLTFEIDGDNLNPVDIGEIAVFPIHDSTETTNVLIAMNVGRFRDYTDPETGAETKYARKYAYSIDNGDTWTTVDYETAFGLANAIVIPVFFPTVNALYAISSSDDYKSFNRTVDGISWRGVADDTSIIGSIKASTNADIRSKVLVGFGEGSFITLKNAIEETSEYNTVRKYGPRTVLDYIYKTSHYGDISSYNDSVFVYGDNQELYVHDDTHGWIPLTEDDGTTLTLGEYIAHYEGDSILSLPTFVDIRLVGSYFINAAKYYTLQSYEHRPISTSNEQNHVNINIWSLRLDDGSSPKMTIDSNTYRISQTSESTIPAVNQEPSDNTPWYAIAPSNPVYIGGVYVGTVNPTNSYLSGEVESGIEILKSKNLLSTMVLDGAIPDIDPVDIGESYKTVYKSKNVDLDDSYGYLMHDVLYDGKKHLLFVGDWRDSEAGAGLNPILFDYRLSGDINFHYDIRLKAYRWNGVKCTQQIKARYITDPGSGSDVASCERAPIKIGFPIDINPNAFMLLYNGIPILDGSAYVNPNDSKEIICENLQRYKVMQNYLNPIQYTKNVRDYIYSDFSVITFSSIDSDKEVHMFCDRGSTEYYGKTCRVQFHTDIAGDLVLFNGIDHEYIINSKSKRKIEYIISRHGLSEAVYANSPYNHIGNYNIRADVPRNIVRVQMCLIPKTL